MKSGIHVALGVLCFIGFSQAYYYGRCRECNMAKSLDDCTTWKDCGTDQACYMEEIITESALRRFNGGCRTLDLCQKNQGKKKRTPYIACTKCCKNDNFCNEYLCGIRRETNLTICNQCNGSSAIPPQYPEDCSHRAVCQANEMCFASTYTHGDYSLRHVTECRNKQVCQTLTSYILQLSSQSGVGRRNQATTGRRDQTICAICCGDDMCNQYACGTIKHRLVGLDSHGVLDRKTLKEKI